MKELDEEELTKDQILEQISSPNYDTLKPEEKRDLIQGYFLQHLYEAGLSRNLKKKPGDLSECLMWNFHRKSYETLEDTLLKLTGKDLSDKRMLEAMGDLAVYMGTNRDKVGSTQEAAVFKARINEVGKTLNEVSNKKLWANLSTIEEDVEKDDILRKNSLLSIDEDPDPSRGFQLKNENNGKTSGKFNEENRTDLDDSLLDFTDMPKNAQAGKTLQKYKDALEAFNTKRSSMFRGESLVHLEVKEAANALIAFRSEALNRGKSPRQSLNQLENDMDRFDYAKKWLVGAQDLLQKSREYLRDKDNSFTFTPAGRARRDAARKLKQLAMNEVTNCLQAIQDKGISLEALYKEIASDKIEEAANKLENIDKNPGVQNNEDRLVLRYLAVHDAVAARVSLGMLNKLKQDLNQDLNQDPNQIPNQDDVKQRSFYSYREANAISVTLSVPIANYVQNAESEAPIINDITAEDGLALFKSLNKYDEKFLKNAMKLPQSRQKGQEPEKSGQKENGKNQSEIGKGSGEKNRGMGK